MLIEILVCLLSCVGRRFSIAEDLTPHSSSFVPYSVRLAVELRHLHRRLLWALYSEKLVGLQVRTYAQLYLSHFHSTEDVLDPVVPAFVPSSVRLLYVPLLTLMLFSCLFIQALLLKALTTLVYITPYQRLQPGLLTSLLPALEQFLRSPVTGERVVDLRAGCLNLLGNVVGKVPGPLLEVCQLLSPSKRLFDRDVTPNYNWSTSHETALDLSSLQLNLSYPVQSSDCHSVRPPNCWSPAQSQDPFSPCWLVQVCLRLLHPSVAECAWDTHIPDSLDHTVSATSQQPYQVRVQALTVLRNMVPNYAGFLRPSLPLLKKTMLLCLQVQRAQPIYIVKLCSDKRLNMQRWLWGLRNFDDVQLLIVERLGIPTKPSDSKTHNASQRLTLSYSLSSFSILTIRSSEHCLHI
ncbi:hypothetical protein P879_07028 [Paragonimus westermani]|uniref:Uncharacterized protein n=1 Tax=Paragonimus westermani TaxID=34504 RepID=A0A8T0DCI4_9TREM|nr:hypothetical protein P879_07028 [Paragonimus westermani]